MEALPRNGLIDYTLLTLFRLFLTVPLFLQM